MSAKWLLRLVVLAGAVSLPFLLVPRHDLDDPDRWADLAYALGETTCRHSGSEVRRMWLDGPSESENTLL